MVPIDTLYAFNCIYVCIFNTPSRFIRTTTYVANTEVVLPQYVNLVGTQYVVSKLENMVELIDRINTLDT